MLTSRIPHIRSLTVRSVHDISRVTTRLNKDKAIGFSELDMTPRSRASLASLREVSRDFFDLNSAQLNPLKENIFSVELYSDACIRDILKVKPKSKKPSLKSEMLPLVESCVIALKRSDSAIHEDTRLNVKSFIVAYNPQSVPIKVPVHSDTMTVTFRFPLVSGNGIKGELKVLHPGKKIEHYTDSACVALVNEHQGDDAINGLKLPASNGVFHSADVVFQDKPTRPPRDDFEAKHPNARMVLVVGLTVI